MIDILGITPYFPAVDLGSVKQVIVFMGLFNKLKATEVTLKPILQLESIVKAYYQHYSNDI